MKKFLITVSAILIFSNSTSRELTNNAIHSEAPDSASKTVFFENSQKIKNIKSIYIGKKTNIDDIMHLLKICDANAVVIDVKDDWGNVSSSIKISNRKNVPSTHLQKLEPLLIELKKHDIYTIARVVAFKDFVRKDLCIKDDNGNVKIDKEKTSWMSPYNKLVRDYLKEICCRAIEIGFNEVQLDYVRFSPSLKINDLNNEMQRIIAINQFLAETSDAIHALGGKISVCVFGCIIEKSNKDGKISINSKILGQDYIKICKLVDFICPMIYPSHYANGSFGGIMHPDLEPYKVIHACMELSNDILKNQKIKAIVRPYLQAFTAFWLSKHKKYRKKEIQDQIQAIIDTGIEEPQWGLFNMGLKYPEK